MAEAPNRLDESVAQARQETRRAVAVMPPSFEQVKGRADRRRLARLMGAGAVVVMMVAAAAVVVDLGDSDRTDRAHDVVTGPSPTSDDVGPEGLRPTGPLQPGEARMVAESPLSPRTGVASAWTGEQFFLWGGSDAGSNHFADGALYDPAVDRWESLPPSPLGSRTGASAVWTGEEVLVLGGSTIVDGDLLVVGDGAAYDPAMGTWRTIETAPEGIWDQAVVADGMLYTASTSNSLLTYDIVADEWSQIAAPRSVRTVLGLGGTDWLVVQHDASRLLALDLSTGEWTELPPLDEPYVPYLVVDETVVAVELRSIGSIRLFERGDVEWQEIDGVPDEPALGSEIGVEGYGWPIPASLPWVETVGTSVVFFVGGEVAWVFDLDARRWSPTDAGGLPLRGPTPGAVIGGGDLVLVWGGALSLIAGNPAGGDGPVYTDSGVMLRLPEPWPEGKPYVEFTTPRSGLLWEEIELSIGPDLADWQIEPSTFTSWRLAYDNERVLYLGPSEGAVLGAGPAATVRLVDGDDRAEPGPDLDRYDIAGFDVYVVTNPELPHETVAVARTPGRTVRWGSMGLSDSEVLAALTDLLEGAAEDWEAPGSDFGVLSVSAQDDGRQGTPRVLLPRWELIAPDGSTYLVRRQPVPEVGDVARVTVLALIGGGRPVASPVGGSPVWVWDDQDSPPSVAWFGNGYRWHVEGLAPDDPNLETLMGGLLG